jgi:uncharacterized membrane protein
VEVDLSRPPARLSPRVPLWVGLAVLFWAAFAIYIVSLGLLQEPTSGYVVDVLFAIALVAPSLMTVALWRLFRAPDGISPVRGAADSPDDELLSERRAADIKERGAWRNLRHGRISRQEYERIIAHRRYVHGEISRPEYHEILRQLDHSHPAKGPESVSAGGEP